MGISLEILAALAVALALGSFFGTFADRLATDFRAGGEGAALRAIGGRSRCLCGVRKLSVLELMPLVGYLRRRGRCAACAAILPSMEPAVEAAALAGAALALLCGGSPVEAVGFGAAAALSVALGWIDLDQGLLPDALLAILALIALAWSAVNASPLEDRAAGAAAGAGMLLTLRWIWIRWRGVEAVGLGDVKLLAIAGFWVGIGDLFLVILIGAVGTLSAVLATSVTQGRRLERNQSAPFGPGLLVGLMTVALWRVLST
jgi:leader peptidase (prepilin peptidase)/N-methyltransferase